MPYADPIKQAAATARSRERSYAKRKQAILAYLGGKCAVCGAGESLEIDHIDKTQKSYNPLSRMVKWATLLLELAKCQLLCETCHDDKSFGRHP